MSQTRYKFPRILHMPFSPGFSSDDKVHKSLSQFEGEDVFISLKNDGENTTLQPDGFHAKSLDSPHHSSRDWVAAFHASIAHEIPAGWRICGENLYARHSIAYDSLPSYFTGFSVWNADNVALNWDDTLIFFQLLGIVPVTQVYRGKFDLKWIINFVSGLDTTKNEGIVLRVAREIPYAEHRNLVAKWVRPGHVQTDEHWMHSKIIPNGLARP
jgi:hypothetical protein